MLAIEEVYKIVDVVLVGIDSVLCVVALEAQKAHVAALYLSIIHDVVLLVCCCVDVLMC